MIYQENLSSTLYDFAFKPCIDIVHGKKQSYMSVVEDKLCGFIHSSNFKVDRKCRQDMCNHRFMALDDKKRNAYASNVLFIQAVALNRFKMATIFLWQGDGAAVSALFASCVLREMGDSVLKSTISKVGRTGKKNTDDALEIKSNADKFKKIGSLIMDVAHKKDLEDEEQELFTKVILHSSYFCLDDESADGAYLANLSNDYDFLGSPALQTVLNKAWLGCVKESNSKWKILFMIFNPWFVILRGFPSAEDDTFKLIGDTAISPLAPAADNPSVAGVTSSTASSVYSCAGVTMQFKNFWNFCFFIRISQIPHQKKKSMCVHVFENFTALLGCALFYNRFLFMELFCYTPIFCWSVFKMKFNGMSIFWLMWLPA